MAVPRLEAKISGDSKGLRRASKSAAASLERLQATGVKVGQSIDAALGIPLKSLGLLGAAAGAAVAAAGGAAIAIAAKSINLAREQEKAEAKLEAVLRATGEAAGVSAGQLKSLASALQEVTNFGDETIIEAESLLLTFKNIGGDVFPRALRSTLDLSAAFGTDLRSATIQLGKALDDPIKGISALTRVGVSFNDQQKEQIKLLQQSGRTAEAQAIILRELENQVGGTAEALADPWIQFQNTVGDVFEQVGFAIKDTFDAIATVAGPVVKELGTIFADFVSRSVDPLREKLDNLFAGLTVEQASGQVLQGFARQVRSLGDAVESVGKRFAGAITGLNVVFNTFKGIIQTVVLAAQGVRVALVSAFEGILKGAAVAADGLTKLAAAFGSDAIAVKANEARKAIDGFAASAEQSASRAVIAFEKQANAVAATGEKIINFDETYLELVKTSRTAVDAIDGVSDSIEQAGDAAEKSEGAQAKLQKTLDEMAGATGRAANEQARLARETRQATQELTRQQQEAQRLRQLSDSGAANRQVGGRLLEAGVSFVSTSAGLRRVNADGSLGGFLQGGGAVKQTAAFQLERGEGVLNPRGMENLQELLLGALNRGGNTVNLGGLTFNLGGTDASAIRAQARSLIPEIQRAARRGMQEALA